MSLNQFQSMELEDTRTHESFKVVDLQSANWCLRKLQALRAKEREINTLADAEIERINEWRNKEVGSIQSDVTFFEHHLTEWHMDQFMQDPKNNKSISTPYGKLKSVTRKPSPKKADDEAILQHVKANGATEYIVIKESLAWAELKKTLRIIEIDNEFGTHWKVIDDNGQEVPGVTVEMGGTTFTVEVSE